MTSNRYRLIDTAGSELCVVQLDATNARERSSVVLPDGTEVTVLEVYDDEDGMEGGVSATLAVDSD
jgi:hypothetical protein